MGKFLITGKKEDDGCVCVCVCVRERERDDLAFCSRTVSSYKAMITSYLST